MIARVAEPGSGLFDAALLIFIGGFLDSYVFLGHGGVFANAQSGNVVLMGIAVVTRQWGEAGAKLPPILAFLIGTMAVRLIQRAAPGHGWHPASVCLLIEIAILAPLATTIRINNFWVDVDVAFAAALQFAGFTLAGAWTYTSIATTGNLRRLADALFDMLSGPQAPEARRRAAVYSLICLAFLVGAALGALLTRRWPNAAIVVPIICLLTILCLGVVRRPARRPACGSGRSR